MLEEIKTLIVKITELRTKAFKEGNEELHRHLGRTLGNLIDAKDTF